MINMDVARNNLGNLRVDMNIEYSNSTARWETNNLDKYSRLAFDLGKVVA